MATLASIITSARYDLVDYETGVMYTDEELLVYLNRMFEIMDSMLAAIDSDLVFAEETSIDTVASQNYVDISGMNSGLWSDVREVWIGQDQLRKLTVPRMYYERKFRSADAQPYYWALHNQQILFETGADAAHTDLIIDYNKKTGDLASSASMPYFDTFNEFFREQLVLHTKMKRLGQTPQPDLVWNGAFKRVAMAEVIRRNFVPKPYHINY